MPPGSTCPRPGVSLHTAPRPIWPSHLRGLHCGHQDTDARCSLPSGSNALPSTRHHPPFLFERQLRGARAVRLQVGKNRILTGTVLNAGHGPLAKVRGSENAQSAGRRLSEQGPLSSSRCGLTESRMIEDTSGSKPRLSVHGSRVSGLSLSVSRYEEGHTTPPAPSLPHSPCR